MEGSLHGYYDDVYIMVIKPGPAQQVDPGPGGWTGPGKAKDLVAPINSFACLLISLSGFFEPCYIVSSYPSFFFFFFFYLDC